MLLKRARTGILSGLALSLHISGVTMIHTAWMRRKGPLVRLLLVHHIKDSRRFERMIKVLQTSYNPISFDDLRAKRFDQKRINVLLTLDDGYESWNSEALPILERYNVPSLCFVSSGFISTANDVGKTAEFSRENLRLSWAAFPLSEKTLRTLAAHPLITIGGHTVSHPFLTKVPIEEAEREILEDKKRLEEMLGTPVSVFAYPFGDYNRAVEDAVARAGYASAITTDTGFRTEHSNPFALPRSNHGTVSPLMLHAWICGAFDITDSLERSLRRLLGRKIR